MRFFRVTLFLSLVSWSALKAETWQCAAGPRLQKTWELYYENGLEASCTHAAILNHRLAAIFHITSSRLGSALVSRALEQENYLIGLHWIFRSPSRIRPWVGAETGYFHLDTESPLFDALPDQSPLLALTGGMLIVPQGKIQYRIGFGLNLITGNGVDGPGTLYPLYGTFAIDFRWSGGNHAP